ncbi:MAG TPA: serine hydrolase, partial [Longimicrobiales bacterium]|nr:serine hydrolase [Longimicrobiales bacterium]
DLTFHENVQSISKALLTTVVGIYAHEGMLPLDATLADLGIDDEPPLLEVEKRARVRDLLTMRSGVFHRAAGEAFSRRKPERGSRRPGTTFFYHNWDMGALNAAFERLTGERFQDVFYRRIAGPLQMQDYEISNARYVVSPAQSMLPHVNVRTLVDPWRAPRRVRHLHGFRLGQPVHHGPAGARSRLRASSHTARSSGQRARCKGDPVPAARFEAGRAD